MTMLLQVGFWLCAGCVLYTYLGYPILLAGMTRVRRRPIQATGSPPRSVSIVVAAHNEESAVERRLLELTYLLDASGLQGEIILVSDGSTDGTAPLARALTKQRVRVLELEHRGGKAAALNAACASSRYEIVVFADVRQSWHADALRFLLENFVDPRVGAVSGELVLRDAHGVLAGVAAYWRYEKWLRRMEGQIHATVGVTGAISAVRRNLFQPIPPGTLLDDVYWPLCVALGGDRVIHEPRAVAYDRLPPNPRDEYRRKVRTLSGNYQLLSRLPAVLLPWRNPIWLQFVSHKLLRLAVPWALLTLLLTSASLSGPLYRLALVVQLEGYALGLLALWPAAAARSRLIAAAGSFAVLNVAAWLAFWVWLFGRAERSWHKSTYGRTADVSRLV